MDKNDFRKSIKQDIKVMRRNKIVSALLFVALGVVLLAWPGETLLAVSKAIGLILAVGGVAAIVTYFVNGTRAVYSYAGLIGGVIIAVLGVWLFFNPDFLIKLFPTIVGMILVISGFVNLSEGITLKRQHGEKILGTFIMAIISVALGALVLVLQMQFASLVTRIMGIALVYDGVSDLLMISKLTGIARTIELTATQVIHDAEAVDVTGTVKEVAPEEAPVEEVPAEDTSVEETTSEVEAPAEEVPVEDTSAEESVHETAEPVAETEETPAEAPADENPAGDDSLIAQPDEFEPDEETPSQTPVEEARTEETPTESETFIDETSTED